MKKLIATILGVVLVGTLATGCSLSEKSKEIEQAQPQKIEVFTYDIVDASNGDEQWELDENKKWPEDSWIAYGPYFKVFLDPMTKFYCTWTAFDKNKNIVGTKTGKYNTLNGGNTTSYGPYEKWYIEASEKIVKSVKTYDVSCWELVYD